MVVFPAASSPTIKIRISVTMLECARGHNGEDGLPFLPNKPDNNFETSKSVFWDREENKGKGK
jgi:hypothetical protein